MISYKVLFRVKKSQVDQALRLINDFIDGIRNNEMETIVYHSFQDAEDTTSFIHVMTFKDKEAEEKHRRSSYCRKFTENLYPLCEEEPVFTPINLVR
jgi:quinol monooxygenase YgiN